MEGVRRQANYGKYIPFYCWTSRVLSLCQDHGRPFHDICSNSETGECEDCQEIIVDKNLRLHPALCESCSSTLSQYEMMYVYYPQ